MKIYIEGLSCAGKSTFIKHVSKNIKNIYVIPELPTNTQIHKVTSNFCRLNDERKCAKADKNNRNNNYVIVDRGYASTLTYEYIRHKLCEDNEYEKTLNWYMKGIVQKKLTKPDAYLYLYINAEESLKRAKKKNLISTNFAWFTEPKHGIKFYEFFFEMIEPNIPLIKINGNLDILDQEKIFKNELSKIK